MRTLSACLWVGLAALCAPAAALAQPAPAQRGYKVALYAPTLELADSTARWSYVQELARALAERIGAPVEGKSFASLAQLRASRPDFALLDPQCVAVLPALTPLASLNPGGGRARTWALHVREGDKSRVLRGARIAYAQVGCDDQGFLFHALLQSEVAPAQLGQRIGKPDLRGALAEVAYYKGADMVFAPVGNHAGLHRLFDTIQVPGPALVQFNPAVPPAVSRKVAESLLQLRSELLPGSWVAADPGVYRALRLQMRPRRKRGLFVRHDAQLGVDTLLRVPRSLQEFAPAPVSPSLLAVPEGGSP